MFHNLAIVNVRDSYGSSHPFISFKICQFQIYGRVKIKIKYCCINEFVLLCQL